MTTPLETLNSQSFKDQLHTRFSVSNGSSAPVALELIAVNEPVVAPNVEIFTLHFRGPARPVLPQQIFRFEHDKIGPLEMFMTTIAAESDGILYEVVFNRIRRKQP